MKAIWNNQVIAQSNETIVVEGNHYFPPESIDASFFEKSDLNTTCPYKGVASYYNVLVDGQKNKDAAWYYPSTKPAFDKISGYIAFWRGVSVVED